MKTIDATGRSPRARRSLEKAPDAYAKMMAGKVRLRMVLTMQS